MAELVIDSGAYDVEIRVHGYTIASSDDINSITVRYGATDGTAPGFGATYAPHIDVDMVYDSANARLLKQGTLISAFYKSQSSTTYRPLGDFIIQSPPMVTEDYQITFSGDGLLGSILDSTYIDFHRLDLRDQKYGGDLVSNVKPNAITYNRAINLVQEQFSSYGLSIVVYADGVDESAWGKSLMQTSVYLINKADDEEVDTEEGQDLTFVDVTAREFLAGLAMLIGCNVVEAFGNITFMPLVRANSEYNSSNYFTADDYGSGYTSNYSSYTPKSLILTTYNTAWSEGWKYKGNEKEYPSVFSASSGDVNYDVQINLSWIGKTFETLFFVKDETAYKDGKPPKPSKTPVRTLKSASVTYIPSNWNFSGFNENIKPGYFIAVNDKGTTRKVYVMEMTLTWTGTFTTEVSSSYSGGSGDKITSSISSGAGNYSLSGMANNGLISGVRIENGTVTAKAINTEELAADVAFIDYLNANTALFGDLRADYAAIKQITVGALSATDIATQMLNADYALISDGSIRSALIIQEQAEEATILNLNTTYVNVISDSGNLILKDNTILIRDEHKVARVQIGEDASGDYNLYLWDADGQMMWDAQGLTESGITRAIIKDNMVADDAGIKGHKIDMNTLFSTMNESGYVLSSAILAYDDEGQTLLSKFEQIDNKIAEVEWNAGAYHVLVDVIGHARYAKITTQKNYKCFVCIPTMASISFIKKLEGYEDYIFLLMPNIPPHKYLPTEIPQIKEEYRNWMFVYDTENDKTVNIATNQIRRITPSTSADVTVDNYTVTFTEDDTSNIAEYARATVAIVKDVYDEYKQENTRQNLTSQYDDEDFTWTRYSDDPTGDAIWNATVRHGKEILLAPDDVRLGCVFKVNARVSKDKLMGDDGMNILLWGNNALMLNE